MTNIFGPKNVYDIHFRLDLLSPELSRVNILDAATRKPILNLQSNVGLAVTRGLFIQSGWLAAGQMPERDLNESIELIREMLPQSKKH